MSAINKIPRGLRVLVTMAILAALVWIFATDTEYFYYSIGAAIVITVLVIIVTYRSPRNEFEENNSRNNKASIKAGESDLQSRFLNDTAETAGVSEEVIPIERDVLDIPPSKRGVKSTNSFNTKPKATDVARKYMQMAKTETYDDWGKTASAKSPKQDVEEPVAAREEPADIQEESKEPEAPVPLIEDVTALTEDEKNELVNAVWAHCENPYCKYSRFLGVHHIVDEKNGGSNRLENLIVLCPFCHDLAHRNEIPEKEMRDWISNREDRFKNKPEWKYI